MDTFHLCVLSKRLSYILFVFPYHYSCDSRSSDQRCSLKKVFWKISQNSQKNTCAGVSLIKLQAFRPATLLKERLWHMCFPVNFAKFWRKSFLQNTSGQLLLWLHALQWLLSLAWSKSQVRKMWWKLTFSSFKLI